MDPRTDGLHGNRYCQVFGNKLMFAEAYPIAKKSDCGDALRRFLTDYGAPDNMITESKQQQALSFRKCYGRTTFRLPSLNLTDQIRILPRQASVSYGRDGIGRYSAPTALRRYGIMGYHILPS